MKLALLVGIAFLFLFGAEAKLKVQNNSYRQLLIAINPELEEDPVIIERLKTAWTDASRDLFQATKKRVYFRSIKILVPKTWTKGQYAVSNGESYNKADVIVADQSPVYGDNPYTVQYGKCGDPGSYIHLTPGYLTDDDVASSFGPRGKTIVHEWAHYRWGVFDETVTNGYDPFYLSGSGTIEANRCPVAIQGSNYFVDWSSGTYRTCNIEPQTMLPEDGCVFFPDERRSSEVSASMMSYQYLDSIQMFCHDDREDALNMHNREAPNEHNRLCNLRSTWDVILNSKDFENEENSPNEEIEDTSPTFQVIRPGSYQRFVLVLDTSGSMDGLSVTDGLVSPITGSAVTDTDTGNLEFQDRLLMMRQAASTFIMQAAPSGSDIGMVEFESKAKTLSDMVRIDTYKDRETINALLPTSADGGTSIGSGVLEALEVLSKGCDTSEGNQCTNGGILIVLSDGEENEAPKLPDVYQDIIDAGVIVHSMVFTENADPMLQVIAQDTGGIWYFADENDEGAVSALTDAFVEVAKVDDGDTYRENFQIHSSSFTVGKYATHTGRVTIDMTVGNNTVFNFAWSQYDIQPGVVLEAPDGCTYSTAVPPGTPCEPGTTPAVDIDLKTVTFAINGTAQIGVWTYYVSSAGSYSENVVVTVTSMASDRDVDPIIVESGMGNINTTDGEAVVVYAQVSMGYAPVINADVTATVTRPNEEPVILVLKDKGAAPDVRKNDGIYSRYFTQYSEAGRYSVQVTVTGVDGKTTSAYDAVGSKAALKPGSFDSNGNLNLNTRNTPVSPPQQVTGIFSRYTSAGGFSFSGTALSDTFPPSQILDLTAIQEDTRIENSGIRIRFTAPGDDFDAETASYYEIRYTYGDIFDLTANFSDHRNVEDSNILAGCLRSPKEAGSDESFLFQLSNLPSNTAEQAVGIAVRAVDDVGNEAITSNVVSVKYFIDPLTYEGPQTLDRENTTAFVLMIVFACSTAGLLVWVGILLSTLRKTNKRQQKTQPGSETVKVA